MIILILITQIQTINKHVDFHQIKIKNEKNKVLKRIRLEHLKTQDSGAHDPIYYEDNHEDMFHDDEDYHFLKENIIHHCDLEGRIPLSLLRVSILSEKKLVKQFFGGNSHRVDEFVNHLKESYPPYQKFRLHELHERIEEYHLGIHDTHLGKVLHDFRENKKATGKFERPQQLLDFYERHGIDIENGFDEEKINAAIQKDYENNFHNLDKEKDKQKFDKHVDKFNMHTQMNEKEIEEQLESQNAAETAQFNNTREMMEWLKNINEKKVISALGYSPERSKKSKLLLTKMGLINYLDQHKLTQLNDETSKIYDQLMDMSDVNFGIHKNQVRKIINKKVFDSSIRWNKEEVNQHTIDKDKINKSQNQFDNSLNELINNVSKDHQNFVQPNQILEIINIVNMNFVSSILAEKSMEYQNLTPEEYREKLNNIGKLKTDLQ